MTCLLYTSISAKHVEEEKSVGVDSDKNDLCFHRFSPVALDGDVYVIYRRKPVKAKVIFIGINADRLFFFNVLRGNIKANFQTCQFTENDIGRSVFLTLEEAEKAVV